jgi:hypothetical protein
MMLLGLIWAMAAPLLLAVAVALVAAALPQTGWSRRRRWTLATGLVLVPVAVLWWQDHQEFVSVCEGAGKPRILARANADGIFLDSPTANSFGMNYLHQMGFAWMEMRSIHDRGKFERVTRDANGQFRTEPVAAISARYEVRETFEQPYPHTGLSMRRVIDRQTGRVMAEAGSAHFSGGRARWVLGAWGTRSFPSAMSDSEAFDLYYYLAQHTLGNRPPRKP